MGEPASRSRTSDRDYGIWQSYVDGHTQEEIAQEYNLSQSAISLIVNRMRDDVPVEERRARQARTLADLDQLRQAALELVEAEPIPAYSNGRPIEMKDEDGTVTVARDYSGRVRGAELLLKVMERQAKALGTDAATKVSVEAQALADEINDMLNAALNSHGDPES